MDRRRDVSDIRCQVFLSNQWIQSECRMEHDESDLTMKVKSSDRAGVTRC